MSGDTTSTANLLRLLRTRLLAAQPPAPAATLGTQLGGRLYIRRAPLDAVYPYGLMRLMGFRTARSTADRRDQGSLELTVYGRTDAQAEAVENAADAADFALLGFVAPTSGLVFSLARQRDTLPPFAPPADLELVAVRCVYTLVVWSALRLSATA